MFKKILDFKSYSIKNQFISTVILLITFIFIVMSFSSYWLGFLIEIGVGFFILAILVYGLSIAFVYFIAALLTKNIYALVEVVKQIKNGDHNLKAPEVGFKEIKILAHEFNRMIEAKNRFEANLQNAINNVYQYKKVLDASSIVSKTNLKGKITYANENFTKVSGYSLEECLGEDHSLVRHPDTPRAIFKELWETILAKKTWQGTLKNRKKDGGYYVIDATIQPILDVDGNIVEFIAVRHDITEIYDQKQALEKIALTDLLTSLHNRSKLLQDLKQSINPSIAIFDIDSFSDVNDFYGHETGDFILKKLGENISEIVGDRASVYRYTSDKFALLSNNTERDKFLSLIDSILFKLDTIEYACKDFNILIKLSVAISFERKDKIIQSVDMILGELKKRGLTFLVYDKSLGLEEEISNNIEWNKKLKDALTDERIVCFYQPIFNNKTNKIEKYESLVRMIAQDGSVISPFKFLNVAKKSKQYISLTKRVIEQSFEKFRDNDLEFSINLTMEDIANKEINSLLDFKMSDKRYKSRVVYEIVESEGIESLETVFEFIKKAKNHTCKIAIDDFGTGYSNFEYLIKLSPHYVKIDGSMIKDIHVNKDKEEVVKTIVDFAKKRHLKTIAEFVSTQEVFDKVVALGIDYSQGYFIGEPKPELIHI